MPAIILAAGRGRRLGAAATDRPKVLLEFGGKTLLQRHLELLRQAGVGPVSIVVGYQRQLIEDELRRLGQDDAATGDTTAGDTTAGDTTAGDTTAGDTTAGRVTTIENPDWQLGSVVSLHQADAVLRCGRPVLLLDGDVLYDRRLLDALLAGEPEGVLLLDRDIEPGDEPVKICVDEAGRIVDFAKRPDQPGLWHGESVGFFRLSSPLATALADRAAALVGSGGRELEYEEPIRAMIRDERLCRRFGFVDITGCPWTEIDFVEDVAKAQALLGALQGGLAA